MALFIDKLKIATILVQGDGPRETAEKFTEALAKEVGQTATNEEVEREIAALDAKTDARFQAMMARMDARFAEMDVRFAEMDVRFAELRGDMKAQFAEMDARRAQMEARFYRAVIAATAVIIGAMSAWAAFG